MSIETQGVFILPNLDTIILITSRTRFYPQIRFKPIKANLSHERNTFHDDQPR